MDDDNVVDLTADLTQDEMDDLEEDATLDELQQLAARPMEIM